MSIDELYAEYRKSEDDKTFMRLLKECQRYCMHVYKKERKSFWAIPKEKALEIAEEQALKCRQICLEKEVECFRRCIGSYFSWGMYDAVSDIIKDQVLTSPNELKDQLGLDQVKITDDEIISSAYMGSFKDAESKEHTATEKWHDIMELLQKSIKLKKLSELEVEIFLKSFRFTTDQMSKITGKSKNQIAKAKCKVKKLLMKKLAFSEE